MGGVEFNVIPGLTTLVRQALYSAVRRQLNTGHLIVSSRRHRLACGVQQKEVTNCSPPLHETGNQSVVRVITGHHKGPPSARLGPPPGVTRGTKRPLESLTILCAM